MNYFFDKMKKITNNKFAEEENDQIKSNNTTNI